jgi:hypothetical protein
LRFAFRPGKLKSDERCDSFSCGWEWYPFERHGQSEDITFFVAEGIEPSTPAVCHYNYAAAKPIFHGTARAFVQVNLKAGLLEHSFAADFGAQRLQFFSFHFFFGRSAAVPIASRKLRVIFNPPRRAEGARARQSRCKFAPAAAQLPLRLTGRQRRSLAGLNETRAGSTHAYA